MSEPILENVEIVDLEKNQTNGQIEMKSFWYRIKPTNGEKFFLTVLAQSSTVARDGIHQQFGTSDISYLGFSEKIIQVNSNIVLES